MLARCAGILPRGAASRRTSARGLQTGLVGLPNVGKSTLFNALVQNSQAAAENYPFCTVEPNFGQVPGKDLGWGGVPVHRQKACNPT